MDKIFTSWVNFSQFSEKKFSLPASGTYLALTWKRFLTKDVLLTCLHLEVVECWGKMILLLLPCCLCICGIVLMKNACGARPPPPRPYDDAGGSPLKGRSVPAECCWCLIGFFMQKFLVFLLGFKVGTPILCETLPKQLFMALREDASFLF